MIQAECVSASLGNVCVYEGSLGLTCVTYDAPLHHHQRTRTRLHSCQPPAPLTHDSPASAQALS